MTIHTPAAAAFTPTSQRANRTLVGTFKSVSRLYAVRRAWLTRRAERHNAALAETGTYTAAQYLRRVIGATPEFIAANAIGFGKAAAKAHRALFGTSPAQDGLTVIGNHPRFTPIATYGPAEYAALEQAARTHKNTAAFAPSAPNAETTPEPEIQPETPTATIVPAKLVIELSDRYYERTPGTLRTVCRQYVAERVTEIVEGMHRTRENYDPATGLLTEAGAAIVTQIIANGGWGEIGRRMDDLENARIAVLNGAS